MKKDPELQVTAQNNKLDKFTMVYNDRIDDALINGLEQNKEFFTMLLNDNEIKHQLMDMFVSDVYHSYSAPGI